MIVSSNLHMGTPSYAAAELTWALVLAAMRCVPQQSPVAGRDVAVRPRRPLRGKTLGVYGYGRIGSVVAGYGKAFGMDILVWGREESRERARGDGYAAAPSREAFFAESDVISLHMRLVAATRGIVTAADLARMKPTALLVNTSRAPLVDPGALAEAVRAGRPGMAAVDVFEQEPTLDHPAARARQRRRHAAHRLRHARGVRAQFADVFDQIVAYAEGSPINVVNPEVLELRSRP